MSVRCITAVWSYSRHAGTELLMLLAIADFADDRGNAYPAVSTLAEKCRMGGRNAQHILAGLRATGELEVLPNEGPKGTNRYRVTVIDQLPGAKPASPPQAPKPLKPASPPTPEAHFTPTPEAGCRGGEAGFAKPLKPASPEPSLNRKEESTRAKRASRSSIPDDFAVSDRVQSWALRKGFDRLDQHLESFRLKASANGYTYADWDAAFMSAISSDWAGLRKSAGRRDVAALDPYEGAH